MNNWHNNHMLTVQCIKDMIKAEDRGRFGVRLQELHEWMHEHGVRIYTSKYCLGHALKYLVQKGYVRRAEFNHYIPLDILS